MTDFNEFKTQKPAEPIIEIPVQRHYYEVEKHRPRRGIFPPARVDTWVYEDQGLDPDRTPWWQLMTALPITSLFGLGYLGFAITQLLDILQDWQAGDIPLHEVFALAGMLLFAGGIVILLITIPLRATLTKLKRQRK